MTVPCHRQPGVPVVPVGATLNGSVPDAGRRAVRRQGRGSRGGGRISRQAMPTRSDSGSLDSPVGFWWSWASGRQAQAVSRAARVSIAPVARGLGPVSRPVIIEIAGLRHDGGPGGSQPAIQGPAIRGGAVRAQKSLGFGSMIGLPGPQFCAFPAHFFSPSCVRIRTGPNMPIHYLPPSPYSPPPPFRDSFCDRDEGLDGQDD